VVCIRVLVVVLGVPVGALVGAGVTVTMYVVLPSDDTLTVVVGGGGGGGWGDIFIKN